MPSNLTSKPKDMGTLKLACALVFTKIFKKNYDVTALFSKNGVIFAMSSPAVQILYLGLFLILNHKMLKCAIVTSQNRLMISFKVSISQKVLIFRKVTSENLKS